MAQHSIWLYIAIMSLVSYLIRVLPVTLIRKQIRNRFIRSVLYYLPYVTLSVMTVPAIFAISSNPLCGIAALVVAAVIAWFSGNLLLSATGACVAVFLISLF
ncbi:MAG: AzlD domain-containing protein [Parasporobacterium sp.]|nr:AzlD domain-containing protein [Parasporobacterium sp.]